MTIASAFLHKKHLNLFARVCRNLHQLLQVKNWREW